MKAEEANKRSKERNLSLNSKIMANEEVKKEKKKRMRIMKKKKKKKDEAEE
jgi:hypothetical protein